MENVPDNYENPFNMVYQAMFEMVTEDPRFTKLVKEGNRLSFGGTTDRDPMKDNPLTSDFPEVMLISTGIVDVNLCATSSSSMFNREYSWVVATGDYRIWQSFAVEWAICTAMLNWKDKLSTLNWMGDNFVKRTNFLGATQGQSEDQQRRGINGWTAVWSAEVEMHFTTANIKNP